jgi:inner membrane protein
MEPVTHVLTGACLARSGLNRKAAYATLGMAVAAEFPDIDTLWGLRGPVDGFCHHRGITHTFVGIPFEAAFLLGCLYGLHRWRVHRRSVLPGKAHKPLTAAPVRWGWLYAFLVLALLSHLLLDFTNNYGLRPFFPFNPHWYAASIVFIFDPLLFAVLVLGLASPWIFGLVSSEVGARRQPFRGRGFAIAVLMFVLVFYTVREVEHNHAVTLAMQQSLAQPATPSAAAVDAAAAAGVAPPEPTPVYLQPQRVLASPDPLSIFRWYTVTDFGPVYQLEQVDTRAAAVVPGQATEPKPSRDAATLAAEESYLGRVYMDWSPMPFVDELPAASGIANGQTVVTFRDPRFMGDVPLLHSGTHTPLTGSVVLNAQNKVLLETMDGKPQPQP